MADNEWVRRWAALQLAQEGTQSIAASTLFCEVVSEIGRLRAALRGVQSCSTCEACRGAATRALQGSI